MNIRKIALLFSIVFQPLFMATYLFIILLFVTPSAIGLLFQYRIKLWLLLVVFLTTFVLPVISIYVMKLTSTISSIHLSDKDERIFPIFLIAIFYGMSAWLMVTKFNINAGINIIFIALALLALLTAFITVFWKISVHSIGLGGVLGILVALNFRSPHPYFVWLVTGWVVLMGATMSARLLLNVHRPEEVYAGAALGVVFCFLPIYIFI